MALTISNWGNFSTNMATPNQGIASEDWAALGRGLGGLQRWSQRQKAADLMEGKAAAQDRIKAIDEEIASLEAKLQEYDAQAKADAQAAALRAEQEQNMQGYTPENLSTDDRLAAQYAAQQNWENAGNPVAAKYGRPVNPHVTNDQVNSGFANDLTELERQNAMRTAALGKYRWGR
jgi:Skp family chaperone for outer membrane proteins